MFTISFISEYKNKHYEIFLIREKRGVRAIGLEIIELCDFFRSRTTLESHLTSENFFHDSNKVKCMMPFK